MVSVDVDGKTLKSANAWVTIPNPATGLTVTAGYKTISVGVGENVKLSTMLSQAFTTTPAATTDKLEFSVADPTIVSYAGNMMFSPLKKGTTTVTASLYDYNDFEEKGTSATPKFTATVTVVVETPATGITLPERIVVEYGKTLDLKTVLKAVPADADLDFSKVTWSSTTSYANDYYKVENNVLTPLKPYIQYGINLTATLPGKSGDTDMTASTTVYLPQPSSALTVCSGYETINVFVGQNDILNDKLLNAFVITPENTTDAVVETIEDETVVNYERGYNILMAGTTKVTKTVYDGIEYMDKGN